MNITTVNNKTMSSSQLAEILGYEKKEVNKKVRAMFGDDKAREVFSPACDAQNRVVDYNLPEKESKMFVAKHDIDYLEQVIQFWISCNNAKVLPISYIDALKELIIVEESRLIAVKTVEKLNTIIDNEFGYSSILRAARFLGVKETEFNWRPLKAETLLLGMEIKHLPSPRFEYQNLYPIRAFENCYSQYDFTELKPETILKNANEEA